MNEAEIRWIVEQPVHRQPAVPRRGASSSTAARSTSRRSARRSSCSPRWGDNITPPQQALNWIVDTYADEHEIKIRGQRIIYMVHDKVGHLGIFVSSSIAKKEHAEVASTMKTIEALAPGLYEMTIDEQIGEGVDARFTRQLPRAQGRRHPRHRRERPHATSAASPPSRGCPSSARKSTTSDGAAARAGDGDAADRRGARARRIPPRVPRRMFGDDESADEAGSPNRRAKAAAERKPADAGQSVPVRREVVGRRRRASASTSGATCATRPTRRRSSASTARPRCMRLGETHAFERTRKDPKELRFLPEVQAVLLDVDRGGFEEAVIRMLILLAESRATRSGATGSSARPRCSTRTSRSPRSAPRSARALIREQSIIVEFEPRARDRDAARTAARRRRSASARSRSSNSSPARSRKWSPPRSSSLQRFHSVLGLKGLALPAPRQDPLKRANGARRPRRAGPLTPSRRSRPGGDGADAPESRASRKDAAARAGGGMTRGDRTTCQRRRAA